MPQVRQFKSEGYGSIGDLLHEASVEVLPEKLRNNEYARWVVKNDPLLRSRYKESNQTSSPFAFVGDFVTSCLQQRIPFYFAALFHLGRMFSVATLGLENIQALNRKDNWQATLANFAAASKPRSTFLPNSDEGSTELLLQKMCKSGTSNFQSELRLANTWWHIWLDEVAQLKATVDKYEHAWRGAAQYDDRYGPQRGGGGIAELCFAAWSVSAACSSKSALTEEMTRAGIRLKRDDRKSVASPIGIAQVVPLVSAFLSSIVDRGDLRYEVSHFSRMLEEWIANERERRREPELSIALDILKVKYGSSDPFGEYIPCGRIATRELRALVKEHTLPDGRPSPWMAEWMRSLENSLSFGSYSPLKPPKDLTDNQLDMLIRAADSTIKAHVAESIAQASSWEQFLQYLFESRCVKEFGEGAGAANKKSGATSKVWSLESFSEFIEAVTNGLNKKVGYKLSPPPLGRLKILLEKATEGRSLYGDDAW